MEEFKANLPSKTRSARNEMLKGAQNRINEDKKRRELFWRDARDMLQSYKQGDQEEFQLKAEAMAAKHPVPPDDGLEDMIMATLLAGEPSLDPPALPRLN